MPQKIRLPKSSDWIGRVKEKAAHNMVHHESCSQSILAAFMEELGIKDPLVIRAAGALHGGLLTSLTCGIHIAGLMVLGLLMGREDLQQGLDGLLPIIMPAQDLMKRLNETLGSHSCKDLTGYDFSDLNQAMQFYASGDNKKCHARVEQGAEQIALFLKEMEERGDLFSVSGQG